MRSPKLLKTACFVIAIPVLLDDVAVVLFAACVIFSQLTDVPCAESSYAPEQLSADDRAALAEVADMLP